jgi:hypothetical protein
LLKLARWQEDLQLRPLCIAAAYLIVSLCAVCLSSSAQVQRPEDAVLAVYRQMELAEQTGNADAWIALWSSKSDVHENASALKGMVRARPSIRYQATRVLVQKDAAGLIGQFADRSAGQGSDQYLSMRFIRESDGWKILGESFSNVAIDPDSLYALVPPPDGLFAQAGSPWQNVSRATGNTQYYRPEQLRWKLQATYDPTYLYIRIEAASALPSPATEVQGTFPNFIRSGVARDWPIMKIRVLGGTPREYTFDAADQIEDKAAFDDQGKATSHRHFVVYALTLWKGDHVVFAASTGFTASPLISVGDRFIDMRIPLKTLGIEKSTQTIEIRDANGPVGMFAPYAVKLFTP